MKRCTRCILPDTYPGIRLDEEGVCNFCRQNVKKDYLGEAELKNAILKAGEKYPHREYDCALGFSGGRDSTYLLYVLKKTLKLNVLAITVDNGFIPPETRENIKKITEFLAVDLVTKKYEYLKRHSRRHLKTWACKPTPAMISSMCVGCRLGIHQGLFEVMNEKNIPVLVLGATPFEGKHFKLSLLHANHASRSKVSLALGLLKQLLKNVRWLLNPGSLALQVREANSVFNKSYLKKIKKSGKRIISPYQKYIHWEEKKIVQTIERELDWKKNPTTKSTWRGDCDIALIKLFLYKKLLGFNDKDDSLSDLIRDGQITRDDALHRLEDEHYISDTVIRDILKENEIDHDYFMRQVERAKSVEW